MNIQINQAQLESLKQEILTKVQACVNEGVEASADAVHVFTGRNRESIRQEDPIKVSDSVYELRLKVGGVRIYGIELEQGLLADVDYSLEEEIRHPLVASNAVPAIVKAVEKLS